MTAYTLAVPGRMVEFFGGGDAGHGKPDSFTGYVGGSELNQALEAGRTRRYGRHGYATTITVSADALEVLREYALTLLAVNDGGEADSGEVSAARTTLQRISEVTQ